MEEIAARVGISAPALYRHYPSKYEMLAATILGGCRQLVERTAFVDEVSATELAADPGAVLDRLVEAIIGMLLANRQTAALWQWQAHYLQIEDHRRMLALLEAVFGRIERVLLVLRPELGVIDRRMLSVGLLSVIGAAFQHRLDLSEGEIHVLLTAVITNLLAVKFPPPDGAGVGRESVWRVFRTDAGVYEALLDAAMVHFGTRGYVGSSLAQIAETVGVSTTRIYRHFTGKYDILATGLRSAVDRVCGELAAITEVFPEPSRALTAVIEALVATVLANTELAVVYNTERLNLTADDLEPLRHRSRSTIDSWVGLLRAVRPELDATRARFLLYVATGLLSDLGRTIGRVCSAGGGQPAGFAVYGPVCLKAFMEQILFEA